MTLSDEELLALVRDDVAHRSAPDPGPLDDVLRTGRRRVAVRRGVVGAVTAAVLVGGTALALGGGLPLLSSAPPAAPSVTLTPDPRRTEALRPAVDMYEVGDEAARAVGLEPGERWSVTRDSTTLDGELVYDGAIEASTLGTGYGLSTAHVPSLDDPGATSCAQVSPPPSAGPGLDCVREPQEDGAVLFELSADGELVQLRLVHDVGVVTVTSFTVDGQGRPVAESADPGLLRELVLDPTLRW